MVGKKEKKKEEVAGVPGCETGRSSLPASRIRQPCRARGECRVAASGDNLFSRSRAQFAPAASPPRHPFELVTRITRIIE